MIDNVHKVSTRQWKRWPDDSRIAFNELYIYMLENQNLFMHPFSALQCDECWKVTAWNAAFQSAEVAKRANKHNSLHSKRKQKNKHVNSEISLPVEIKEND